MIHSREWMPVSSQMAGRFDPPVLNCTERGGISAPCPPRAGQGEGVPGTHLQHVQGSFLVALPDLDLANEAGMIIYQHVHPVVDLKGGAAASRGSPWLSFWFLGYLVPDATCRAPLEKTRYLDLQVSRGAHRKCFCKSR